MSKKDDDRVLRTVMMCIAFVLFVVIMHGCKAHGQTPTGTAIKIEPWVGPNDVRYFYEIDSQERIFKITEKGALTDTAGFAVIKAERVRGVIQWIQSPSGDAFRYTTVDGRKEVYMKRPGSRGFGSEQPLQLYVCEAGPYRGWVFVIPDLKSIRVTAPERPAPVDPAPTTSATPPVILETKAPTESRSSVTKAAIYRPKVKERTTGQQVNRYRPRVTERVAPNK
jgi:hypothetical protein